MRHGVVTLKGTSVPLKIATALGLKGNDGFVAFYSLQPDVANLAVVYIGGTADPLTTSNYGFRLEIPVSNIPSAPYFRESRSGSGPMDLTQLQVIGASGELLRVSWEPFF